MSYRNSRNIFRRDLLKAGLFAAGAPAVLQGAPLGEYDPENTKIATMVSAGATDEELLYWKQIGLRWVHLEFGKQSTFDVVRSTQERLARYGLQIHCGICDTYRSTRLQLGQPGRDEDIEKFQTFIRDLGRLGIPSTKIDFHPANTYTTSMIESPRGYRSRQFSVEEFRNKVEKQAFDREYSAAEMWANYTYFIKAVLPVAEKANVRLALHPDDPPLAKMNGVAKLFTHYNGYKRADEIANHSPYWGLTFCVGTWSEGGDKMGKDVFGIIDDFGRRGKIFAVHFRNVSSPLPVFHETFQDDGYMNMYEVMKAFRRVRCTASLIPDHYPGLTGDKDRRLANTYSIAYMRALLRRANEEVG